MTLLSFITLITLQFNTSNFIFKNTYNISGTDLKEISYFLEKEYAQLTGRLKLNRQTKVKIVFCNTTDDFVLKTRANRRIGAIYKNNSIFLQPLFFLKNRKILYDVLRHELVHAILDNSAKNKIPKWFNEAFAIYVSGEMKRLKKKAILNFGTIRQLESCINSMDYRIMETSYYYLGLSMQFLINNYGEDKIISLLNNDILFEDSVKKVLGEPFETLEKKIVSYVRKF
jgi:hypothetical protein